MNTIAERQAAQLADLYPTDIVEQLAANWQEAPLPDQLGESIPYLRINRGASERPVLYIPGFCESIPNKVSFAAELALHGLDVILPGENRRGLINADYDSYADLQGRNYRAVLAAENITPNQADYLPHSFGSMLFESMVKRGSQEGEPFDEVRAVLLAPSGLGTEKYVHMAGRWLRYTASELSKSRQSFPDLHGFASKASLTTSLQNIRRTFGESWQLAHHRIDVETMAACISKLAILSYAEDHMFPNEFIAPGAEQAVRAGVFWAVPYYAARSPYADRLGKNIRGAYAATHNDEQVNPHRVVGAILPYLRD